jgi:hypothetical protein
MRLPSTMTKLRLHWEEHYGGHCTHLAILNGIGCLYGHRTCMGLRERRAANKRYRMDTSTTVDSHSRRNLVFTLKDFAYTLLPPFANKHLT